MKRRAHPAPRQPVSRLRRAVYPGSFDPVTYGHLDLIRRALAVVDELIVGVAQHNSKQPLFSVEERVAMLQRATRHLRGVRIEAFDSLVVDFCRAQRAPVVIRGLRMISDFEYEFQMALTNRKLADRIETIFLMPSEAYAYLSSRLIKEAGELGADLSAFVPDFVAGALRAKWRSGRAGECCGVTARAGAGR